MPSYVVPFAPSQIYQPNGRLVDLIRLQGEQSAEAQRRQGELQARMWGGIGQSISEGVGSVLKAKENAPINELNRLKVQDALDLRQGQQVIDRGMKDYQPVGPQPEGEAPAQAQHPYLDAEGLADPKKITDLLAANGLGHLAPELLKGVEAQNSSILAYKQHQQETGTKQAVMLGSVANTTLALMKAGMSFPDAAQHASSSLVATGAMDQGTVQKTLAQLSQLPPEQIVAQLTQMKATAAQLGPTSTLNDGAQKYDMFNDLIASNEKKVGLDKATFGIPQPDGSVKNVEGSYNKETGEYSYQGKVVPNAVKDVTPPAAPASQAKSYRVKGVGDVPLEFVPGRTATDPGAYYLNKPDGTRQQLYPGRDFTDIPAASLTINDQRNAASANLPSWALDASRPVGPDGNVMHPTLHMTPNGLFQDAQTVIATGQYPQMARGNDPASSAKRAAIDSKIGAIAAEAGMDVPALRAFYQANRNSLTQQQKAYDVAQVSIAKADRDVDLLQQILPKIGDVGSPMFNKPLRSFEQNIAGNPDLSEFATRLRSVQNEYTRILNASLTGGGGGVMSDSARHETDQLLDPKATVAQIIRSISALKSEGANRLLSQGEQIQRIQARMSGKTDTSKTTDKDPLGIR